VAGRLTWKARRGLETMREFLGKDSLIQSVNAGTDRGFVRTALVGPFLGRFVDDGAVLERPQIEHADGAIGAAGNKYIDTIGAESG
jgi:hypothetical protein